MRWLLPYLIWSSETGGKVGWEDRKCQNSSHDLWRDAGWQIAGRNCLVVPSLVWPAVDRSVNQDGRRRIHFVSSIVGPEPASKNEDPVRRQKRNVSLFFFASYLASFWAERLPLQYAIVTTPFRRRWWATTVHRRTVCEQRGRKHDELSFL